MNSRKRIMTYLFTCYLNCLAVLAGTIQNTVTRSQISTTRHLAKSARLAGTGYLDGTHQDEQPKTFALVASAHAPCTTIARSWKTFFQTSASLGAVLVTITASLCGDAIDKTAV